MINKKGFLLRDVVLSALIAFGIIALLVIELILADSNYSKLARILFDN